MSGALSESDIAAGITDQVKIVLIGDSGIGKTAFLMMYCDDTFSPAFVSTVGIDFKVKVVTRGDKKIKLQIWDTAGQERYRTLTTAYFRGSNGFVLMFDLTNRNSFQSCVNWIDMVKEHTAGSEDAIIVLVGNKVDLATDRVVTNEEANDFAVTSGIKYFETSAKDNINLKEVFDCIIDANVKEPTPTVPPTVPPTVTPILEEDNSDKSKPSSTCWC